MAGGSRADAGPVSNETATPSVDLTAKLCIGGRQVWPGGGCNLRIATAPLLGLVSLLISAFAMGDRAMLVPSATHLLAATDLFQVLDTSDVPDGVVDIVTGPRRVLAGTLAEHHDVAALWSWGSSECCGERTAHPPRT